jgi:SPP1 gp7 family putative phage head morphogenesis protein
MGMFEKIFRRKANEMPQQSSVQSRPTYHHPFAGLNSYVPLTKQLELYKLMREAIPVLDTAIYRIVRLVGTPTIEFEKDSTQKAFDSFFDEIRGVGKNKGFKSFHSTYFDSMLQNGYAAGEILPNRGKNDIYALLNIDAQTVRLKQRDNNPLDLIVCQEQAGKMEWFPLPQQELILFTALNPEADDPHGVSLFRSLPFVTEVLLKIFNSIGLNWERFGNLKYQVVYTPASDTNNEVAKERKKLIDKAWQESMSENKKGKVKDFTGVGDIKIKVIGADNQILDSEVPGRQMLEQIVSSIGLPPFMLGLHWSTTERMSSEQSDILTSELWEYRYALEPVNREIVDWWLRLTGRRDQYETSWQDINLKDEVEQAKAEMYRQQARKNQISNVVSLRNENIIDQQVAAEELGYEKPKGQPPTRQELSHDLKQPKTVRLSKKQFDNRQHREKYWKALKDHNDHPIIKKHPDRRVERLMVKFENAIMESVNELEKRIFNFIGLDPDDSSKAFDEDGLFYVTAEEEQAVSEEIETFINDLLGEVDEAYAGIYHLYLMESFKLGVQRAREAVEEFIPDIADGDGPRVNPNWDHPYVRELANNGGLLIQTRAREMRGRVIDIMKEHAARGDNPEEMARSLHNDLHDELGGKRWYWRRLARSESAMALDRADDAEYEAEGILYVEWVAAPDACAEYCMPKHRKVYSLGNAPKVVADTHPHCRCRKRPVTSRYALESGRVVF